MRNIFLYPYGGGSASSYRSYVSGFPQETARLVPLEIPGRGARSNEPFAESMQECAARTLPQLDTQSDGYVLHGHCMGALLAFEAIKLLEATGARLPLFMVASGRNAPPHVNDWLRRVATLDDRSLFGELQELGGIPKGLSFAMAQQFLTVIRHDQAMFRDYDPGKDRINVPILVLAGRNDEMTNAAALADWQEYTWNFISVKWMEGGHYFIFDQIAHIAQEIDEFGRRAAFAPVTRPVPAPAS